MTTSTNQQHLSVQEMAAELQFLRIGYKFPKHQRCLFCGDTTDITTGWLPVVGGLWKCPQCQEAYNEYRKLVF